MLAFPPISRPHLYSDFHATISPAFSSVWFVKSFYFGFLLIPNNLNLCGYKIKEDCFSQKKEHKFP